MGKRLRDEKKKESRMTHSEFAKFLLSHYALNYEKRSMPWRRPPKSRKRPPAYEVWLSEVMLQQTTVAAVIPYFNKFVKKFPDINDLAKSNVDEVLNLWAGLGYYSRARNLHKAAIQVAALGGNFPSTENELKGLSGVGDYTAAAIAAIAFGQRVLPIDGNIERIGSRLFRIVDSPKGSNKLREAVRNKLADHIPFDQPGDFAQGLMDVGSKICTPKNPNCRECPLSSFCKSAMLSVEDVEELPRKPLRKMKPYRTGVALAVATNGISNSQQNKSALETPEQYILIRRRPNHASVLGGMWEIPWGYWPQTAAKIKSLCSKLKKNVLGVSSVHSSDDEVKHVFSGFDLQLRIVRIKLNSSDTEKSLKDILKICQELQHDQGTLQICEQPSWVIAGAKFDWYRSNKSEFVGWSSLGKKLCQRST